MKKFISVILVMTMLFSFGAVYAYAVEGDYQTYYVSYEIQQDGAYIQPVEGYQQYVEPGADFKFTIEVERDEEGNPLYSNVFVIVEVNHFEIEPDMYGVYTIENIQQDTNILVYLTFEQQTTNFIASLLVMIKQFFKAIIDTINQYLASIRT